MAITKYPPRLNLQEAIAVIKSMYREHKSREVSIDLMPTILTTKRESSFFDDKISALKKFGFVDRLPNDILYLTDVAMQIIMPVGSEDVEAKIQAFKKIDVLNDLFSKYPNGKLPSADQLKQNLYKVYQVPKEKLNLWYDFVLGSFRAIAELSEQAPSPLMPSERQNLYISQKQEVINLPSGKVFSFSLEAGYTENDLDFIIGFLELKKKNVIQ
jgi:hypothetical protein